MMGFNKLTGTSVGADVSALGGIHDIPLNLLKPIIGPICFFSYPGEKHTA
jgi:hypothetical protein